MSTPQQFHTGEIRRWMDVYTFDGHYLGNVLSIDAETVKLPSPELDAAVRQSSQISGEARGPMPTYAKGNGGPTSQSARMAYATGASTHEAYTHGRMLVGKYYGLLGLRRVPIVDVQTVALERIVLRRTKDELARSGS